MRFLKNPSCLSKIDVWKRWWLRATGVWSTVDIPISSHSLVERILAEQERLKIQQRQRILNCASSSSPHLIPHSDTCSSPHHSYSSSNEELTSSSPNSPLSLDHRHLRAQQQKCVAYLKSQCEELQDQLLQIQTLLASARFLLIRELLYICGFDRKLQPTPSTSTTTNSSSKKTLSNNNTPPNSNSTVDISTKSNSTNRATTTNFYTLWNREFTDIWHMSVMLDWFAHFFVQFSAYMNFSIPFPLVRISGRFFIATELSVCGRRCLPLSTQHSPMIVPRLDSRTCKLVIATALLSYNVSVLCTSYHMLINAQTICTPLSSMWHLCHVHLPNMNGYDGDGYATSLSTCENNLMIPRKSAVATRSLDPSQAVRYLVQKMSAEFGLDNSNLDVELFKLLNEYFERVEVESKRPAHRNGSGLFSNASAAVSDSAAKNDAALAFDDWNIVESASDIPLFSSSPSVEAESWVDIKPSRFTSPKIHKF